MGFSRKMIFLCYEDFVDIFGGIITKLDYIKGSFLCILGSFLKVMLQNGFFLGGLLKFQMVFLGCLKFLILFWSER